MEKALKLSKSNGVSDTKARIQTKGRRQTEGGREDRNKMGIYVCDHQRLGRDGIGREQRPEQKTTGQGKCEIRAWVHLCGSGKGRKEANVVDTMASVEDRIWNSGKGDVVRALNYCRKPVLWLPLKVL